MSYTNPNLSDHLLVFRFRNAYSGVLPDVWADLLREHYRVANLVFNRASGATSLKNKCS